MTEPALLPAATAAECLEGLRQPLAITGGTGFVGSHLVDTLCEAGIQPRVLVRSPESPRWIAGRAVELVPGSLESPDALSRLVGDAGTVIHLAGVVRAGRAEEFERGNLRATANLMRAVRDVAPEARVVHISSLAAAGPSPSPQGRRPADLPDPISAYGRSKLGAEREVIRLGDRQWWTILRPPAIYGPRDTDVFEFFRFASRGVSPLPAGERWLTVAHVADVVRAILAAASRGENHRIYHLGEPEPYRLDRLLDQVAESGGVRARLIRLPPFVLRSAGTMGSLLHRLGFSGIAITRDKAREILARHWTAETLPSLQALGIDDHWVRFAEGAAATWCWYRDNGWLR